MVLYKRSAITPKIIQIPDTQIENPKNCEKKIQELNFLNAYEQRKLLDYPISTESLFDIRDRCVVVFLLATGLFIEELINLTNKNVNFKKGYVEVYKGNRGRRKVYFDVGICQRDYEKWLEIHPLRGEDTFHLFVTRKLNPLSIRSLYTIVSNHLATIGISKKNGTGANLLRQTAIVNALEKNPDLDQVRKNFGIETYEHIKAYNKSGYP